MDTTEGQDPEGKERGDAHLVIVGAVFGLLVAAGGAIDSFNGTLIALGLLTTALTGAYTALKTHQVHKEVKTGNELRIGEMEAARETRRVEEIPHDERTAQEQRHIDTAPETGPAQGPSR